jgi:hypothetical protein
MEIRKIGEEEREEIEKYLMLDDSWLYSLIPPYLPEYKHTEFAPEGQIEAGKNKFQELKQRLYVKICKEWDICKKIDHPMFDDELNLVVVIGDAISTVSMSIPPFLIASIILKIGLRKFCDCPS